MRIWMVTLVSLLAAAAGTAEAEVKNPLNPTTGGHFEVVDPAEKLGPDKAEAIYRRMLKRLRAPYESEQHGGRYLSNYGNTASRAYGRFEAAGILPPGAIIAKDSFSVNKDGQVMPGPLFIMEKMAPGFDAKSGDWRYSQIMPDGSILGISKGPGGENMEFCADCHARVARQDHLFFLPQKYRAKSRQ